MVLCECGCGQEVNSGRFLQGHGRRGHTQPQSAKDAIRKAHTKYPPDLIKVCKMATNKECSAYLGIYISEMVLSKVFKDVVRMPHSNPGYDFICNRGKHVDAKTAATGYKGYWRFDIAKNQIADYFLCLAFESRDDLYNPVHLWMIPGHIINHLVGLTISKGTISKWSKYELPLNKLVACCNNPTR